MRPPAAVVPVALALFAALPLGTAAAAPQSPPADAPAARKPAPDRPVLRFALRLTRQDISDAPAADRPVPAPVALAEPTVTTLDGETASVSVTAADLSYNFALSPTILAASGVTRAASAADNPGNNINSGNAAGGRPLQLLWNVRLAGRTLPGGATSVALTGASRLTAGSPDAVIAEISLTDPMNKRRTVFRLSGTITVEDGAARAAAGTPPPAAALPPQSAAR